MLPSRLREVQWLTVKNGSFVICFRFLWTSLAKLIWNMNLWVHDLILVLKKIIFILLLKIERHTPQPNMASPDCRHIYHLDPGKIFCTSLSRKKWMRFPDRDDTANAASFHGLFFQPQGTILVGIWTSNHKSKITYQWV